MAEGIYGNSEDLENSPDNTTIEVPGEENETDGAGPDQGQPGESRKQQPNASPQGANAGDENEPASTQGEATGTGNDGLILGKFKDPAALAQGYQHLERQYGQMGTENAQLRQLVQHLYQQAMLGAQSVPHAGWAPPVGAWPNGPVGFGAHQTHMAVPQGGGWPQQGQMVPQGVAPPQSAPQTPTSAGDDTDPNKWLEEFYEKGPAAVDARIEARARKIAEEMINQAAAQYLAPIGQSMTQIQQFVNQEAMRRYYSGLAQAVAAQNEDFATLKRDVEAVLQENPHLIYLPFQTGQNPYQVAYQEAKRRKEAAQAQEQQTTAQKKGAQMPRPNAAKRQEPQPQDAEKAYVRNIFGLDKSGASQAGIFGQIE